MHHEVTKTDHKRNGEEIKSHHVLNSSVKKGTNSEVGLMARHSIKLSFLFLLLFYFVG